MSKIAARDGGLPKGWRKMKLGEVCSIDRRTLPLSTLGDYRFDYISLSDIDKGSLLQTQKYNYSEAPSRARRIVAKGDVLLSTVRPNLQGFYLFRNDVKDYVVSTGFAVLSPKNDLLYPPYLYQTLFSQYMLSTYYAFNVGSNYPAINSSDIHEFKVVVPPLLEQKAIASLLETWDTAIEKTEALLNAKQKRFKWLLKTLIANNRSGWKHYKSMNLFESVSRRGYSNEQLLSATQDQGVVPRSALEGRVMSPSGSIEGYKLVEPGNFTISLRSFQGGIEYSDYRGVISPAYTVLTPVREIVDDFYRHFFKSYIFIEKYLSLAVVGIREGKQINFNDFKTIKIPYPPLTHQQRIADTLNNARKEIDILKQLAEHYRIQKRGLMQKLLTGELKVNT